MTETRQVNGVDVFIEGEGAQTIVMIHGWPDTHRLWDSTVQALQGHYRCVRFTLPGFDAGQPRRSFSIPQLVATFRSIVEQTCPGQQVILMLHDWGCAFGYAFAAQHPALVSKIVGVDIGDAGSRAHREALPARAKLMVFAYQAWLALAWVIGGHVSARLGDRMTRWMARVLRCRSDPGLIGWHMNYPYFIQWSGAHGSYRRALRFEPSCPMLYLWGRKKPFQFHSARWVEALRAKPGCQALEFDTGHWLMTARPQAFNEAVAAWLAATA